MSINAIKKGDVVQVVSGIDSYWHTDVSAGDLAFVESDDGELSVWCRRTGRIRSQMNPGFLHVRQMRVQQADERRREEELRRVRHEVIALRDLSGLSVHRVGTGDVFTLPAQVQQPDPEPAPFVGGGGSFGGGGASGDWSSPVSDAGGGFSGGDAGASF
jgi:hypothetical protein